MVVVNKEWGWVVLQMFLTLNTSLDEAGNLIKFLRDCVGLIYKEKCWAYFRLLSQTLFLLEVYRVGSKELNVVLYLGHSVVEDKIWSR